MTWLAQVGFVLLMSGGAVFWSIVIFAAFIWATWQ